MNLERYKVQALTAGGGTINVDPQEGATLYVATGSPTLVGSWVIQYSPTAAIAVQQGLHIQILWLAAVNLNGNSITLFGTALTQEQVDKQGMIDAYYDGASWQVRVKPDFEENNIIQNRHLDDDAVDTVEIVDDAVTNDKLANMTQGTVKVGGALNAPTDLSAETDGNILIGDGTDVNSVAVSGDVTITNAGVTTVDSSIKTTGFLDSNVTVTGTTAITSDELLMSYTLTGGTVDTDGTWIEVVASGTTAANANAKTIRLRFGGSVVTTITGNYNNADWKIVAYIYRSGASAQEISAQNIVDGDSGAVSNNTLGINWAANQNIEVWGQNGVASANDIQAYTLHVKHVY